MLQSKASLARVARSTIASTAIRLIGITAAALFSIAAMAYEIPTAPNGTWTVAGSAATKTTPSGVRVQFVVSGATTLGAANNVALLKQNNTTIPALPATSNGIQTITSSNATCNAASLTCAGLGSVVINFADSAGNPIKVKNPVLHLSRMGGLLGDGVNTYFATAVFDLTTAGVTLATPATGSRALTATATQFLGDTTVFPVTAAVGTNFGDCIAAPGAAQAGCGSIPISGTTSTLSFNVSMLRSNTSFGWSNATPSFVADGIYFTVSFDEDFGDAPTTFDGVNPAVHTISDLMLGNAITADNTSTANGGAISATPTVTTSPNAAAAGAAPILDGSDDGLSTIAPLTTASIGSTYTLTPTISGASRAGQLCGWIDFNRDNLFTAAEGKCSNFSVGATSVPLTWTVPAATTAGPSYLRLRVSYDATAMTTASFNGPKSSGEVEDYRIEIKPALRVSKVTSPTTDTGTFNLAIAGTDFATAVGNGGTTNFKSVYNTDSPDITVATNVATAAITGLAVSETVISGGSYTSTYSCSNALGAVVASGSGTSATITVPQSVTGAGANGNAQTISCTFTNTVAAIPQADMAASGNTLPTTVLAGQTVTGSISCKNNGPSDAAAATCSLPGLPVGATVVCTPTTPTAAPLISGASISCNVSYIAPVSGTVSATVTAGSSSADPTPGNNTTAYSAAILPADMKADAVTLPLAVVGVPYVGNVSCTNIGIAPALGADCVVGGLPPGLTASCTPIPPVSVAPGATISCLISGTPLAVGAPTITLTALAGNDSNVANNVASAPLTILAGPALAVTKTVSNSPLVVGVVGQSYTITIKNTGGVATSSPIFFIDPLATGISTSGLITAVGGSLSGCSSSGAINLSGCSIAAGIPVGASVVLTVPINVASSAIGTGTGTNTANIFGGGDLSCTATTPCVASTPATDVKAQQIDAAKSVGVPVQTTPLIFQIPYTIVVKNTGAVSATNIQVIDDLSATFSSGTPVITVSSAAAIGAGACVINPTTFNGTSNARLLAGTDNLVAGAACTITFTVQVAYPNAAALPSVAQNNTAVASAYALPPAVSGGASTGNPLISDKSANGNTPVAGDLASPTPVTLSPGKIDVVKSAGAPKNTAANTFEVSYSLVVGNVGSTSATVYNVQVNDSLAAAFPAASSVKVKAGSYSVTSGGTAACAPNAAFNGLADTRLLAGTSNLTGGQSCTINFTVEVLFAAGQLPTAAQSNTAYGSSTPAGSSGNPGYVITPATGGGATVVTPPANAISTDISNSGPPLPASSAPGTPAVIPSLPSVSGGDNPSGTPTQVVLKINPGKITGSVWDDNGGGAANGNNVKDAGEAGIAGWVVEVIDPVTRLPLIGTDGQPARTLTNADGTYSIANIPPGKWSLQFRAPGAAGVPGAVFGVPVNGEQTNSGSLQSIANPVTRSLDIDVTPSSTISQQSLPLDPSGIVYDSATRAPIGGVTVTLIGPDGQPVPSNLLLPNQQNQLTVASGPGAGAYRFDLLPGAPGGNYTIKITSPAGYTNFSSVLPPQPGSYTPPALPGAPVSIGSGKAPQAGDPTSYYMAFNLTPGASRDVVHNNIPLDPTDSGSLFIRKEVNRASVEIGDALTYRITVRSTKLAGPAQIVDKLPLGFKLIPNTTKLGAASGSLLTASDPAGTPGPLLTFSVNLPINQDVVIEYKVRVSIGADRGDGTNRAQAQLGALRSLEAQVKVKVSGGVFTRDACVIGKVFVDCNQNKQQDAGEPGIPGVRMYLEDGTNITTDENGQYSICGLRPITHVLKIDSTTMPIGSRLGISSSRNAGDADSLFVDLTAHELYRADFIEQSCFPKVLEQVDQRRKLGPVLVPQKHDEGKDEKWDIQFNSEQHKLDRTPSVNEGGRQ
jgi:uncharacterized repeat protein (TIGR01451 family)